MQGERAKRGRENGVPKESNVRSEARVPQEKGGWDHIIGRASRTKTSLPVLRKNRKEIKKGRTADLWGDVIGTGGTAKNASEERDQHPEALREGGKRGVSLRIQGKSPGGGETALVVIGEGRRFRSRRGESGGQTFSPKKNSCDRRKIEPG